jgi:hypothetical protein
MHLVFFGKIGVTLSRVRIISRKAVGKFKDIEINFHAKNSLNDDLESKFRKTLGDALSTAYRMLVISRDVPSQIMTARYSCEKRKAKCRPTFEPRGTTSMKHSMFELVPRATRWGQGEGGGTDAVLEHSCCEVTDGDEDEAIKTGR